ncbi:MAG: DUF4091 domain-containing protein [Hungatella hathewayi]|uniref:DUF4091 domain-containing protein n=1 Tax=Hungatella TaxID=1649459 RepID=UPI00258ACA2E|nr:MULTISPECIES: DUF4091 domain-containing protein [Hungatella]MCI7380802.1 DUF4091 domain-containing protein [Hungatella sp.]MDY6235796.1 DUF4091 domain-containing protein [Hungatella hathewayi]
MSDINSMHQFKLVSCLQKVFPDEEPRYSPECQKITTLKGETVSFQMAFRGSGFLKEIVRVECISPIADSIRIRSVENVPVGRACNDQVDDNYLRTEAGMYPDLLRELDQGIVSISPNQWRSLWIDVEATVDMKAGNYPIKLRVTKENEVIGTVKTEIIIYDAVLPKQKIMHTEWMHADCLADYYKVEPFSEEHWRILDHFFELYVKRGGNMMLTPMFTPPLDIALGGERTTVQLVGVKKNGNTYEFDFSKMKRWIDLCIQHGIEYFEMSHLFSQWGARYAPKIIAEVNGEQRQIFGWHTPAVGEYTEFLNIYLPQLRSHLEEWGISEKTYFHLSDEPGANDVTSYKAARDSVDSLLKGFHTFDALSDFEFYRQGLVEKPVPGNNEIAEFLEHGVDNMWVYYCTMQYLDVSNRFMAMPSARNRIYGLQIYKYDIIGILHWGYNFYNSQWSTRHINPYEVTDADYGFPAGDSFLIYPGEDGYPEESIRGMVLNEALNDLRACQLLEALTSKEYVLGILEEFLAEPLTFTNYPKSDAYLIMTRNRINGEIAKFIKE